MSDEDGSGGSGRFSHDSPRPPVPGGEELITELPSHPIPPSAASLATPAAISASSHSYWRNSPQFTPPRRRNFRCHSPQAVDAPLGFEPEGASGSVGDGSSRESSGGGLSPPACLRWACNLHSLLEDSEGVDLFTKYLQQEGQAHADTLSFWFACEGLKKQKDPKTISQLVRVIHKRYFIKSQLAIPEELRREVTKRIKERGHSGPTSSSVFDDVQSEVEKLINETTYPNFLESDLYLKYVQSVQINGEVTSTSATTSSSSSSGGLANPGIEGNGGSLLQTVHEDVELETLHPSLPRSLRTPGPHPSSSSSTHLTLTKDMLIATQTRRALEFRPKTEAFAETFLSRGGAHPAYSSYNPVSRQDSELQSLSSGARTESDNMSLTDSSHDGTCSSAAGRYHQSRKQFPRQNLAIRENAFVNRDGHDVQGLTIPRPQRNLKDHIHPRNPEQFAALLIQKLEAVVRNRENEDKINRLKRYTEEDPEDSRSQAVPLVGVGPHGDCLLPPRILSDAIRHKLLVDEDNNQAILDEHVSRVWVDLTPSRSPRPRSPEGRRRPTMQPFHHSSRYPKKEKDVFSTFSSDSGNVRDMPEGSLPKSRSMPDYSHSLPMPSGVLSSGNKRINSEQLTEDSGVSVVSDSGPSTTSGHHLKEIQIRSWLRKSEKTHQQQSTSLNMMNPSSNSRHSRNKPNISGNTRSESLERCGGVVPGVVSGSPAQPFVADPSMPPLPSPHTSDQLEEARRRLIETSRGRMSSGKPIVDPLGINISGQSTLRKSGRRPVHFTATSQDSTTVVYNFCDEQLPYRTKIPGRAVTLRQFKEFLPKKGAYRFFFKTECDDLDIGVIQEEITDDNVVLPLWEGKIMAQVKFVD